MNHISVYSQVSTNFCPHGGILNKMVSKIHCKPRSTMQERLMVVKSDYFTLSNACKITMLDHYSLVQYKKKCNT